MLHALRFRAQPASAHMKSFQVLTF